MHARYGLVEELAQRMITVFVKQGFTDTWNPFLRDWAGTSKSSFGIRTYQDLAILPDLPAGPIVFSDIERLTDADRVLISHVLRVVTESSPETPVLNDPARTLRRYDLLTDLHERGLNPFQVYRLTDTVSPRQFPVFLRYENDHTGATTGLLHNTDELSRAIVRSRIRGHDLRKLLIVEFVDTRDADGRYMKYGAFIVGRTIIGRHVHRSDDWVVKYLSNDQTPQHSKAELAYVNDCPHEPELHNLFDIGSIEYGRIDYSVLNGSIVTWEINTNPVIISDVSRARPLEKQRQELFTSRFISAFRTLQSETPDLPPISLHDVSRDARSAVLSQRSASTTAVQRLGRRYKRWLEPVVRTAEFASIPFENRVVERWKRANGI